MGGNRKGNSAMYDNDDYVDYQDDYEYDEDYYYDENQCGDDQGLSYEQGGSYGQQSDCSKHLAPGQASSSSHKQVARSPNAHGGRHALKQNEPQGRNSLDFTDKMKQLNVSIEKSGSSFSNERGSPRKAGHLSNSLGHTGCDALSLSRLGNTIPWKHASEFKLSKSALNASEQRLKNQSKTSISIVVCGHVDSGKSSLFGCLLASVGVVDNKTVKKSQRAAQNQGKSSFGYAYILDTRPDERERGITMDVTHAVFQTQTHIVTVLDSPGHRDFVPQMLSGASLADGGVLVVDGSIGGFEKGFSKKVGDKLGGQTREHACILNALGISQVLVIITKLDTCNYEQKRFNSVRLQVTEYLQSLGYLESNIQCVPAVPTINENVTHLALDSKFKQWYTGVTVLDAIDRFQAPQSYVQWPARIVINSSEKGSSSNSVNAFGRVVSGVVQQGMDVWLVPSGAHATVKNIYIDSQVNQCAIGGDTVELNLHGTDLDSCPRGSIVCSKRFPARTAGVLCVKVGLLDNAPTLAPGMNVEVQVHTHYTTAIIKQLVSKIDPQSGEVLKQRPRLLSKSMHGFIELTVKQGIGCEIASENIRLSRVVLRQKGETVGVGVVHSVPQQTNATLTQ